MFQHHSRPLKLSLAMVACGLLTAFGPVARAQNAQTTSLTVSVADLDLSTPAGAAELRHRVQLAVRKVCGPAEMVGSPDFASYRQCLDQANRQATPTESALIALAQGTTRYAAAAAAK